MKMKKKKEIFPAHCWMYNVLLDVFFRAFAFKFYLIFNMKTYLGAGSPVPHQIPRFQARGSNPSQGNFLWCDSNDNSY